MAEAAGPASDPAQPHTASHSIAAWIASTREWAATASQQAGAPPRLTLLASVPNQAHPSWRRAPSFAAAAALLVPAAEDRRSINGKRFAPSAADLASAAAISSAAGLRGRALWALGSRGAFFVYSTPYPHLQDLPHRQAQLLPLTLQLIPQRLGSSSGSGGSQAEQQQQQQASCLFAEIAADQTSLGLRLLGWVLTRLFRWLFNSDMYVDTAGLQRVRDVYHQQPPSSSSGGSGSVNGGMAGEAGARRPCAALVYVAAHKSHLDYLMLSYMLFASGLPCPHIAAGANLSLPLVGRWLRACGAFFIRRTSRGTPDSPLYKAVLAAYVHALLQAGHSLEFFVEGGRSRDGRVNSPKLGMLRMVVDAVLAGDVERPVYIVPTAMNYDALLEERSLAAQLAGAAKKSESLGGLARTCWGIVSKALRIRWQRRALGPGAGGYCGRATVAFGEPISLQQWLQGRQEQLQSGGSAALREAVAALGEAVAGALRRSSVLPTSALLLATLFADRHGISMASAAAAAAAAAAAGENSSNHRPQEQQRQQQEQQEQQEQQAIATAPASGSSAGSECGSSGAAGTTAAAAAAGMDWLAAVLEQRGAAVVRLPRACCAAAGDPGPPDCTSQQQWEQQQERLVQRLAGVVPRCCTADLAASRNSGGGQQPQLRLRLLGGVEASLLLHSRLNQLLPWLAEEGLLVAALLVVRRHQQQPPPAGAATAGADPCSGGEAGGSASVADVLETAAWLRCLLAPEIDTALGPEALRTARDFEPTLRRMLASGALGQQGQQQAQRCGEGGGGGGAQAALFAGALLAPLLATYLEVLRTVQQVLGASSCGTSTSKALCAVAQRHLLALAAGASSGASGASGGASSGASSGGGGAAAHLVVPSVALVQGALRSLAAMGVLVPAEQLPLPPASSCSSCSLLLADSEASAAAAADLEPAGADEAATAAAAVAELAEGSGPAAVLPATPSRAAVDEEYYVEVSPSPGPRQAAAAAQQGAAAAAEGVPLPSRSSFERQHQRRLRTRRLASAAATPSRSGSDSELDPAADSVAANLCSLDSSPNRRRRSSRLGGSDEAGDAATAAAGVTLPLAIGMRSVAEAAALPSVAAQPSRPRVAAGVEEQLALAVPEAVVQQLIDRIQACICVA